MSTYAIGDIQGCFDALTQLLEKIDFNDTRDFLWFTGDLVNRGQKSLETLRFIKQLYEKNRAISVLGNHDLGMLAIARGAEPFDHKHHTFQDILNAKDKEDLFTFLEHLPLMHIDEKLGFTMVHAGIYPKWDKTQAKDLAREVEAILQSPNKAEFYKHLYGNTPVFWDEDLPKFERLRFIVNSFARMRFCSPDGELEFNTKEASHNAPPGFLPWYKVPDRKTKDLKIIFGHWAALLGKTDEDNIFALDTGCVWGHALTAMRLEDGQRFQVSCNGLRTK